MLSEGMLECLAPSTGDVFIVEVKLIMKCMEPEVSLLQILTDSQQVKL